MAKSETPARDAVLVKYLNEAYGKEKQLETALTAQIALAQRPQLKKGLQDHLKVTKAQSKGLAKRMKELGGKADAGPDLPGPDVAGDAVGLVGNVANRALAAAKGPVQALRGTSAADNQLRNVRDCLWNEAEEIAHYNVIEAAAETLGDRETVKLAKTYRRQEEAMQKLLERQIAPLMKEVVREEVPSAERRSASPRRRSSNRSAGARKSTSRGTGTASSRSASSNSSSRKATTTKRKPAAATRKPATAKKSARSSSSRAKSKSS